MIPLFGNEVEILLHFLQRLGIELELAFAAGADAVHNSRALQHAKMLGNCLPSQPGTLR